MIPLSSQTLMMNLHHGQTQEYVIKPKYYPVKKVISGEQSTEGSLPLRLGQDQLASPFQCKYNFKKHTLFSCCPPPPFFLFKILKISFVHLNFSNTSRQKKVKVIKREIILRLANAPAFFILLRGKRDFLDEEKIEPDSLLESNNAVSR